MQYTQWRSAVSYIDLRSKLHALLLVTISFGVLSCDGIGADEQEMMSHARQYMAAKEINAAVIELKNLLQKNAAHGEARFMLAEISLMRGDLKSAEKEVRHAIDAGWNEPASQRLYAEILLRLGENDKLRDIPVKDVYPAEVRADLIGLWAAAAIARQDLDDARKSLELGAPIDSDARWILLSGIRLHLLNEEVDKASAELTHALTLYPDDQDFWLLQAAIAENRHDTELYTSSLRRVLELDPPKLMTFRGRQAALSLVQSSLANNDIKNAGSVLDKVLKQYPGDPAANYFAAVIAYADHHYDKAIEYLNLVLKVVPEHRESLQLMGNVNYAKKDFQQAAYYLQKATLAKPDDMAAQAMLGKTYLALGQYGDAEERLKYVSSRVKKNPELTALIGITRLKSGDTAAGVAELEKASLMNPEDMTIKEELARAYVLSGNTQMAIDSLESIYGGDIKASEYRGRVILILAYLQQGKNEAALKLAQDLSTQIPNAALPVNLAGAAYEGMRDYETARKQYQRALDISADDVLARLSLAELDIKDGDIDTAASRYQEVLKKHPDLTTALIGMARISAARHDSEHAIKLLEKARAGNDRDTKSRLLLANYYLTSNNPVKALEYADEAQAINGKDLRILAVRAAAQVDSKNPDAKKTLDTLLAAAPDLAYGHYYLAKYYLSSNNASGARKSLEKAIELAPDYLDALVAMSNLERLTGNFDAAFQIAKSLQKKYPGNTAGYLLEADVLIATNKPDEAIKVLTSALPIASKGDVVIRISKIHQARGRLAEGYSVLKKWIESHPEDISVRYSLAVSYMLKKDYSNAINAYESINDIRPDIPGVLNDLAWLYNETGKPGALEMARRAHQLVPDNPAIQDTYGWLLVQGGRTTSGLTMLEEAAGKAPGMLDIQYHYASALEKSGDKDKAKSLLEKILATDKPFSERESAESMLKSL
jgi:putative PEP-CTERM system TPR-repeat lipoprotein